MAWGPDDLPRISGLEITGIEPFREPIEFEIDPEVNVFIGPNATGKSTILRLLCPELRSRWPELAERQPEKEFKLNYSGMRDSIGLVLSSKSLPHIYFPPVREVAPLDTSGLGDHKTLSTDEEHSFHEMLFRILVGDDDDSYYAAFRLPQAKRYIEQRDLGDLDEYERDQYDEWRLEYLDNLRENGPPSGLERAVRPGWLRSESRKTFRCASLYKFDPTDVWRALNRVIELNVLNVLGQPTDLDRVAWAVDKTDKCILAICPEFVKGGLTNLVEREQLPDDASEARRMIARFITRYFGAIRTVDWNPEWDESGSFGLWLGELSTGTQGLIWWIWSVALSLAFGLLNHRQLPKDGDYTPGILCIDEIENHLHPTWQRRVIPALRKHFPGLQIFATTHSPFVVAGLKRGQIHRLYREKEEKGEKRVIKTDKLTKEEKERRISGWTVEQVLREFMDVDDPTDEDTAEAAAKLRWLRDQMPGDGTAAAWVEERVNQHLRKIPDRTRDEDAALRWLSGLVEKPDSLADQTALDSPADQKTALDSLADQTALEWWEATLATLRSSVSLDIEAGGPFAAQREKLIAQIRELLADDEADSSDPEEEG